MKKNSTHAATGNNHGTGLGSESEFYGVVDGVYVASANRVDDLSNRMFARNMPSHDLQPNFDMRPVATKYTVMPVYDQYKPATEPMRPYPVSGSRFKTPSSLSTCRHPPAIYTTRRLITSRC